jgi:tRNA 2-thiouridine synthesizing protein A
MAEIDPTGRQLDLRGLKCPLPVLHTRKALHALRPGERLVVLSTDPLARLDLAHLAAELGDDVEDVQEAGPVLHVTIRKAGKT